MITEIRKESIKCFRKSMEQTGVIVNNTNKKFEDSRVKKEIQNYNYRKSKFLSNLADALEKNNKTNLKGK